MKASVATWDEDKYIKTTLGQKCNPNTWEGNRKIVAASLRGSKTLLKFVHHLLMQNVCIERPYDVFFWASGSTMQMHKCTRLFPSSQPTFPALASVRRCLQQTQISGWTRVFWSITNLCSQLWQRRGGPEFCAVSPPLLPFLLYLAPFAKFRRCSLWSWSICSRVLLVSPSAPRVGVRGVERSCWRETGKQTVTKSGRRREAERVFESSSHRLEQRGCFFLEGWGQDNGSSIYVFKMFLGCMNLIWPAGTNALLACCEAPSEPRSNLLLLLLFSSSAFFPLFLTRISLMHDRY